MPHLTGTIVLLLVLLAGAIMIERAERDAPDPYAACAAKPTRVERDQCRHAVDFARSVGW